MTSPDPQMVTLYPILCLLAAATFLLLLHQISITHHLIQFARYIDPDNQYIEPYSEAEMSESEFELDSDSEDEWYSALRSTTRSIVPSSSDHSSTPSYATSTCTNDDDEFRAWNPRVPLEKYFDPETGFLYPHVLQPQGPETPAWERELTMRMQTGTGLEACCDRAVERMVKMFVGLHV